MKQEILTAGDHKSRRSYRSRKGGKSGGRKSRRAHGKKTRHRKGGKLHQLHQFITA
jgi:hypothetical protein